MKKEVIKYELSHDGKKIKKGKLKLYIQNINCVKIGTLYKKAFLPKKNN
jgi:hypothetical protein